MLSFAVVMPKTFEVVETALSPPLTMNVPVSEPEVDPTTRFTLIDPRTEPWAWKSLLVTMALKLSTVDIGVGEGEGDGEGEGVGEGEGDGEGVGVAKTRMGLETPPGVAAVPPQAATDPKRTTITPHATRAAFGMTASYAPGPRGDAFSAATMTWRL